MLSFVSVARGNDQVLINSTLPMSSIRGGILKRLTKLPLLLNTLIVKSLYATIYCPLGSDTTRII